MKKPIIELPVKIMLQTARKVYPKTPTTLEMPGDPRVRHDLSRFMEEHGDCLSLTCQVSSKVPSIGTQNRLRIVLFDRAQGGGARVFTNG